MLESQEPLPRTSHCLTILEFLTLSTNPRCVDNDDDDDDDELQFKYGFYKVFWQENGERLKKEMSTK